ncbi:MAG: thymidine phosphorylase [Methanobacteriota archaeon]|jgi:thymidine phosphorylase|nr:MAG: thymidine phosphorylase [Euryarchaeota archaeon]HIE63673.1 thymidine phosphorylase [Candidatus Poseidoniales archaeon]HIK99903.1 thymidine phosphorylase [Candidatus Poseidoniales archaeon]
MGSISEFIDEVVSDKLEDDVVIEWLKKIFADGLNDAQTIELTKSMRDSGEKLEWPAEWANLVVDKHSTGGVGDKVSIPLAPALAACGLKVPMISGRGLGHTGGTLDKLESIPEFRVDLSVAELSQQIEKIGVAMVGQTNDLVPADRRLYALRDVTGTIASIPLITSSIVSKKAAEGLTALVIDVKFGRAAFMVERAEATKLARSMSAVANALGIQTTSILSDMNSPLGCAVGNALEIVESVETLCGRGPLDLEELVCVQGGVLLHSAGIATDENHGAVMIHDSLNDGSAFNKFLEMVEYQGGNADDFLTDATLYTALGLLDSNLNTTEIFAEISGNICDIDAMIIADICLNLGTGRNSLGGEIDHRVGIILEKQIGELIEIGDHWATIYHSNELDEEKIKSIQSSLRTTNDNVEIESRIVEMIR